MHPSLTAPNKPRPCFSPHNDLPTAPGRYSPPLPCLPPASTLQVDVNGDAEGPTGRGCIQEHACPASGMYSISSLTSSRLDLQVKCSTVNIITEVSGSTPHLSGLDGWFIHRGTPCCLPRLKGEQLPPSCAFL